MKRNLQFLSMLLLMIVGGTSFSWADIIKPTADIFFRTNLDGIYSWSKDYPKTAISIGNNTMAGNHRVGMFVLQKYTIENFANVKSITLTLTGGSSDGTDALAIWPFANDWSNSSEVTTLASQVNSVVGLDLNTYGTAANSPLVNGATNRTFPVEGIQVCNFVINGDNLVNLKNAAVDGTFGLLITNRTGDMAASNSGDRKLYCSGHEIEEYHPYITVEYYPVTDITTGTNYESLNAAVSAITEGEHTLVINNDIEISSRVDGQAGATLNIIPARDGITITRATGNTGNILFLPKGNTTFGCEEKQLIIDGNNVSSSSVTIEQSNVGSTILKNVIFKNCISTNNQGILCRKSNGDLTVENVTFENCIVNEGRGVIFNGKDGLTLKGNIDFKGCTGYDFYLEKRLNVDNSGFKTSNPLNLYIVEGNIQLNKPAVTNVATTEVEYFNVVNETYGLYSKGNRKDLSCCEAYTLNVTSAGAATLILPFTAKIPTDVSIYTINYTGGETVVATPVETVVDANTPVLINASEGKYKFVTTTAPFSSDRTIGVGTPKVGALTGVYETTTVPSGSYVLYADATHDIGFYPAGSDVTVGANRAYLTADGAGARLAIVYGDETNAIEAVKAGIADDAIYTLSGVRVEQPTRGIYVKNGKKFIVK